MTEGEFEAERKIEAKRKIASVAAAMIGGSLSYIEGARRISELRLSADMVNDDDIMPFVLIDSETDALPSGAVRELWNPIALAALQPQIDKAEAWAEEVGLEHCKSLIDRLSTCV